ncbi:hypothetical protein POL58_30670 [Nannocystis sp. ncelm1]|uniref:Uncharacterized protein n=1 Tax=Nannocystis radixulma TaxID=2995305 RepID=A0ABT5BDE8_9BACT|nr:hypothetical protein [Nannocystis radixulma]MDC0672151.1 hypothetical protein [Nannocystis radixulma]
MKALPQLRGVDEVGAERRVEDPELPVAHAVEDDEMIAVPVEDRARGQASDVLGADAQPASVDPEEARESLQFGQARRARSSLAARSQLRR